MDDRSRYNQHTNSSLLLNTSKTPPRSHAPSTGRAILEKYRAEQAALRSASKPPPTITTTASTRLWSPVKSSAAAAATTNNRPTNSTRHGSPSKRPTAGSTADNPKTPSTSTAATTTTPSQQRSALVSNAVARYTSSSTPHRPSSASNTGSHHSRMFAAPSPAAATDTNRRGEVLNRTDTTTTTNSERWLPVSTRTTTSNPSAAVNDVAEWQRGEDFRIGAIRTTADLNIALEGSQLMTASSRANELQAQLQLKEIEADHLRDEASALRTERSALQTRLAQRLAELDSIREAKITLDLTTKQAQRDLEVERAAAKAARAEADSLHRRLSQQGAVVANEAASAREAQDLRQSNGVLYSRVEELSQELKLQREKVEVAEKRAVEAEGRVKELQRQLEDLHETTDERRSSLFNEVRRLAADLKSAEQRAIVAENALEEERSHTSTRHQHSAVSHKTEMALTQQLRSLATQLQEAQADAAAAKKEAATAQASLNHTDKDEVEQLRSALKQATEENTSLKESLQQRETELAQSRHTATTHAAETSNSSSSSLEREIAHLTAELRGCRGRIAELEDSMARFHTTSKPSSSAHNSPVINNNNAGTPNNRRRSSNINTDYDNSPMSAPSPLRDVVNSLRGELRDRELRLAAAMEDCEVERRRAEELQQRLLDQALELDDIQGRTVPLRQQLQAALEGHRAAVSKIKALEHALHQEKQRAMNSNSPTNTAANATLQAFRMELEGARSELNDLRKQNAVLLSERDTMETEFMALQGRVRLMEGNANEAENWLMTP